MRSDFFTKQALPLARARFSRCANVATDFAVGKRIRIACNVAPAVASNVAAGELHRVAFSVEINVVQVKRIRALNVASVVASPLRRLFTNSLRLMLPAL